MTAPLETMHVELGPRSYEIEIGSGNLSTIAALLDRIQCTGEAFVSNAVVRGCYLLRACIVNFRTSLEDIEALPEIVLRIGRAVDAEWRPEGLKVKD